MGKWLVAGAAALAIILFLLWRQLDSSPSVAQARVAAPEQPTPIAAPPAPEPKQAEPVASAPAATKTAEGAVKKLDPATEEFIREYDETVTPKIARRAVRCIENRPKQPGDDHRSLVLSFKHKVRNGHVAFTDVKIVRNELTDAALEACFIAEVRNSEWDDARIPDWDQDDQIKLNYDALKKYTRANMEATGPEAPPMMPKPADHP